MFDRRRRTAVDDINLDVRAASSVSDVHESGYTFAKVSAVIFYRAGEGSYENVS